MNLISWLVSILIILILGLLIYCCCVVSDWCDEEKRGDSNE